jgi:hypothetical protein
MTGLTPMTPFSQPRFYYPDFRQPIPPNPPILTSHPSHPCHNNNNFNGLGMTSWVTRMTDSQRQGVVDTRKLGAVALKLGRSWRSLTPQRILGHLIGRYPRNTRTGADREPWVCFQTLIRLQLRSKRFRLLVPLTGREAPCARPKSLGAKFAFRRCAWVP